MLGAGGYTGKCLSLLLKHSDHISELYLYDIVETKGIACDLSHIETASEVRGYTGRTELHECLKGSDLVIMAAGQNWSQDMSYDRLLAINGPIAKELGEACATVCPHAFTAIVSRPVRKHYAPFSRMKQKQRTFTEFSYFFSCRSIALYLWYPKCLKSMVCTTQGKYLEFVH